MVFESRSEAESEVVGFLRKHLKAPYEVIPSTDYASIGDDKRLQAGEFDALVFHPERGILVIEVKGGGVGYDGKTRKWYSLDHKHEKHLIKDPFKQVRKAAECLRRAIAERCTGAVADPAAIPVGYAVFLPDVNVANINLPLDARKELILDSSDMLHLADSVPRIMDLFRREYTRPLTPKEVAALHARVLYPTCCVLPTLKSQIAREEAAFVAMTEEQKVLLDLISDTRQVAIKGYAGSGKTLLAVEKARRLYHDGLKVAVLCFNRPLADDIRRTLVDCSDRVDVDNFHGLCWRLCEDAGIDIGEIPADPEAAKEFWDEVPPIKMLDAIAFYIFFDPNQAIYCDETRLDEDHFGVPISDLLLKVNSRSTRAICELACNLGGVKMVSMPGCPKGAAPEFIAYESDEDQVRKIDACVERLIREDGLAPEDIVCLSTHSRGKSCLARVEELASFPITDDLLLPKGQIRFSSLHRFKGLEANIVLLCDVDGDPGNSRNEHLYVAVSRAKHRVEVFHASSWSPLH